MVGPENQKVTFIELFFDLVFVFSVTQVVGLMHDGVTWTSVGQSLLVFWMVWWAWTQFTWALNAADTTHYFVEIGTLLATVLAFFMAVALPDAFHDRELWFAIPYVLVRTVGLVIYSMVTSANPEQRTAVRTFAFVSVGGMVAVIAGAIAGGDTLYWLWGISILLDVIAAGVGGRSSDWNLYTEHFVERHGLFVIIALGETLIVTAGGVTGADWDAELITVAVLAVAITFAFWWSYFPSAKPRLEHALEHEPRATHAAKSRDVFSLLHFPMICGIIALAVATEEAIAHSHHPLEIEGRLMLAAGLALFVGVMALATFRANGQLLLARAGIVGVTAAIVIFVADVSPITTLAIAFTGTLIALIAEEFTVKSAHEIGSLEMESAEN